MKARIFKIFNLGLICCAYIISNPVNAGRDFESDYTNQIYGYVPIIESIGAVIVKKGENVPFVATDFNSRTSLEIGDTVYIPVNVLQNIKDDFEQAYFKGSFDVIDEDNDTIDQLEMAMKVEWLLIEDLQNYEVVKTIFADNKKMISKFGVGYTINPEDLGKYLAFRITPIAKTGMPKEGETLEVKDLSKMAGQTYPTNADGEKDPTSKIIINKDITKQDHPNIGDTRVKGESDNSNQYSLYIYRLSDGAWVKPKDRLFVDTDYIVKVIEHIRDEKGEIIKNEIVTDNFKNNIIWQLYLENEEGELEVVASTGLSDHASGHFFNVLNDKSLQTLLPKDFDISIFLNQGTTQFSTQKENSSALYKGAPNYSEQGLTLGALLVIGD